VIGYYVHHQGSGHLQRARSILSRLESDTTVLSSLPRPDGVAAGWVQLERDDDVDTSDLDQLDVTAHDVLHWVPRHGDGLRRRARQLLDWVDDTRPALAVVDVSVEVSMLFRLAGVPLVVAAMPGRRDDHVHALAYDMADVILAPWPEGAANGWSQRWHTKTRYVGGISRFDGRAVPDRSPLVDEAGAGRGLLLGGFGGSGPRADALDVLQAATPGWTWTMASAARPLGDDALWAELTTADVVVTTAGQGSVADVAAARAPAVVVAEERPFDEQAGTVRALTDAGLAVALESWPADDEWPALLEKARGLGGARWSRWSSGEGASGAAGELDELAGAR
jgi:hypothetical protein